ncbi:hypothetical protein KUV22_02780 [Microbulbifer agarilyticus]|uniref:hypothetical protein n=1 Tax=Microbulbifer agarilyticus TaxID=260552 RepID=UPI001C96DB70|nr:hypothetical protein [Microbulbifer agarilyticus]MBY6189333.1 hypothetical protein [Microbulbifer agarilyticus]
MKYFDRTMTKALLALSAIVLFIFTVQFLDPGEFSTLNLSIGLLFDLLWAGLLILALRAVKEYKLNSEDMSVWAFLWRVLIAKYLGLFLSIFAFLLLPVRFEMPSLEYTLFMYPLAIIFSVSVLWLLFSTNRLLQLKWAMGAVRG